MIISNEEFLPGLINNAVNLKEIYLSGPGDSFSAALDVQFFKDMTDMGFGGVQCNNQSFSDLLIG